MKGGFEVVAMQWKNGKLEKLVVKSTLGGNARLRVPNELKLINGGVLNAATGTNPNPFYQIETITAPVVSHKASLTHSTLPETKLYDLKTDKGKVYTLVLK